MSSPTELPRLPRCFRCGTTYLMNDSINNKAHESIFGHKPERMIEPDEERIESIITPHGIMQLIPPGPIPEPRELSPDEQREAAQRYMQARYGKAIQHNYTDMVHRNQDGSDPLVQEPKGKP